MSKTLIELLQAVSFVLGAGTFVVSNVVLIVIAYPTLPNPGPQQDVRLPIVGLVVVIALITVLLGRAGRAFGLGFAVALLAESLFMRGCTDHWLNPGGAKIAEAAAEDRIRYAQGVAAERYRNKWMAEVRHRGLDLAVGVQRLNLAVGCVLAHRKKQGALPPIRDSLPDLGELCSELQLRKHDESGWRILYSRIPGRPGDPAEYRVQAGPDAGIHLQGPLLEEDYRGIILRRDSANGPAFAVGSPLQPVIGVVMDCIRKNAPTAKPESRNGGLTLRDLVFTGAGGCTRIDLKQVKTDGGSLLDDPNVARLYLPTAREFAGVRVEDMSTAWDLTYVPHGKTPADGYDLYLRPMEYGFTGVRSYLLTNGQVHVTWEERRATSSDPLAEACELDPNTPCKPQ